MEDATTAVRCLLRTLQHRNAAAPGEAPRMWLGHHEAITSASSPGCTTSCSAASRSSSVVVMVAGAASSAAGRCHRLSSSLLAESNPGCSYDVLVASLTLSQRGFLL